MPTKKKKATKKAASTPKLSAKSREISAILGILRLDRQCAAAARKQGEKAYQSATHGLRKIADEETTKVLEKAGLAQLRKIREFYASSTGKWWLKNQQVIENNMISRLMG